MNAISDRKVYPSMVKFDEQQENRLRLTFSENRYFNLFWTLRMIILRFCINRANRIVGIGRNCISIFRSLGYRIDAVIPNGVADCVHAEIKREDSTIFFAGRLNGKGFDLLLRTFAEAEASDWHFYFAGGVELYELAVQNLNSTQFTYLGKLSREEVLSFMHRVKFVAVLSQYFDNYPTVALEAIMHGAIPITTPITGVADLVRAIDPLLVIPHNEQIDLKVLEKIQRSKVNKISLLQEVINLEDCLNRYQNLLTDLDTSH
jgi:glycosyltransferase involved in cell wall biosynthesis